MEGGARHGRRGQAWKEGEVRPTARPKATKPRGRRRPDPLKPEPLKNVTAEFEAWFGVDPGLPGRQLLERLQAAHPDAYPDKLLRTVQRRLEIWHRERATALVFGTSSTIGASPGLSGGVLRYAEAPRAAGEPLAPVLSPLQENTQTEPAA